MSDDIRYLGDLQLLKIEPGDKFVLTMHKPISAEVRAVIEEQWAKFAGADVPLLVLEPGMSLGAIRTQT